MSLYKQTITPSQTPINPNIHLRWWPFTQAVFCRMQVAHVDEDDEDHDDYVQHVKRARKLQTFGPWLVALVVIGSCGIALRPPVHVFDTEAARSLPDRSVLGVVVTRWEFVADLPQQDSWLLKAATRKCREAQLIHGYLKYPVVHFARLVQPIAFRSLVQSLDDIQWLQAMEFDRCSNSYLDSAPLQTIMNAWLLTHSVKRLPSVLFECSQSLGAAVIAGLAICHVVVVSGKVNRKNLLQQHSPSKKLLGRLRSSSNSAPSDAPGGTVRKTKHAQHVLKYDVLHCADMLIEWLGASKFVKAFSYMWAASKAFSRIFAKYNGKKPAEVLGATAKINAETLRQARTRLDIVCMNLFRKLWRLLSSSVYVFLYLDSSPQAGGVELFALSFEIWALDVSIHFVRRLMPIVLLPRTFWDARGKLVALLWCIWLLVGPRPDDVLRFVRSVRSITTDLGTERLLAIMPDILPDFFGLLLGLHIHGLQLRQLTFDFALQCPGWMRSWDVIVKRSLSSLS